MQIQHHFYFLLTELVN